MKYSILFVLLFIGATTQLKAQDKKEGNTCHSDLIMPNAFTPQGESVDPTFKPTFKKAPRSFKMSVYNRWGELMFETTDYLKGWDGEFKKKPMPSGVYVWIITFSFGKEEEMKCTGNVTLLR